MWTQMQVRWMGQADLVGLVFRGWGVGGLRRTIESILVCSDFDRRPCPGSTEKPGLRESTPCDIFSFLLTCDMDGDRLDEDELDDNLRLLSFIVVFSMFTIVRSGQQLSERSGQRINVKFLPPLQFVKSKYFRLQNVHKCLNYHLNAQIFTFILSERD